MSAPTAHVAGHALDLSTLRCDCGEWVAEGDSGEFKRLAFESWKAHAKAYPLAPVEAVRAADGSQWLKVGADAGGVLVGLLLVAGFLLALVLLAPAAFSAGKVTRSEIGTPCVVQHA